MEALEPGVLRWVGVGLVGAGVLGVLAASLTNDRSLLARWWARYVEHLSRELRFQRSSVRGRQLALGQLVALGALALFASVAEDPAVIAIAAIVAVGPHLLLRRKHEQRVQRIEEQLDGWLIVLANGLRAAPSLGEAIRASVALIPAPLSEELDVLLKEMQLGTPLDRAVLDLGARIRSRTVQGALAALLVGRQTGGELSAILEETAASMREMTRLEGVLRAKTAEGRSQAYVLGAIPFFLIAAIHWIDPHWLEPLTTTTSGMLVTSVSTALWLAAVLIARRVLAVDL